MKKQLKERLRSRARRDLATRDSEGAFSRGVSIQLYVVRWRWMHVGNRGVCGLGLAIEALSFGIIKIGIGDGRFNRRAAIQHREIDCLAITGMAAPQ